MASALCSTVFAQDVKITPVASVTLGGGRYFYSGAASNGGSADAYLCPVVNFSRDTALLPMYFGTYRGTKDVRELVGGGTLTQETQDHALTLRFITRLSDDWRLRARGGYKVEYVRETVDESWGAGLFDQRRALFGIEGETAVEGGGSVRFGADYYAIVYPNYQSLVTKSEFETSLDTTTYKELSTNAGTNPLDNTNLAVSASYSGKLAGESGYKVFVDVITKNFNDQSVVIVDGSFSPAIRRDLSAALGARLSAVFPRARAVLSDTIENYSSNQNSFDAGAAKFLSGHYNYIGNTFSPSISFSLGEFEPFSMLSIFAEFAGRYYSSRPAQSATGVYTSDKMYQATQTAGLSFTHPIYKGFSARMTSSYRTSYSNNLFEGNYKYNYDVFSYFMGINWDL
jgi:hypothetical protein